MKQPTLRWMRSDDMDQVAKISDTSKRFIKDFLRRSKSICSVMVLEEQIVGIIFYEIGRRNIKICHIAVDPSFRKTKIATQLVNNVILKLNKFRNSIVAEVSEHNLSAQLFFKKMGFRAVKITRFDTGGDTYSFKYLSI
jgi:ribosomal-protein-alanine N-acetyltransferase